MAADEIGSASFGLVVGLQKFGEDLGKAEQQARGAAQRIGDSVGGGVEQALGQRLTRAGERIGRFGSQLSSVGTQLTVGITAPLLAVGGLSAKAAIDFESAMAGVRKTVDATDAEFAKIEAGIRQMSKRLPQSAVEIAGVAEAAGQLGIAVPNILSFSEVMVGLGTATNMSSEQAATALARLANITQMPQTEFDRLGSTVVALGNNLATTEAEIVEMGLRIAGAGRTIGLTESEILGLAGALSSVGIEAEAGGSAISRVMINMANAVHSGGGELAAFAQVAGMTATEFGNAFRTEPIKAIAAFVAGLQRMQSEGLNVFEVLDGLELGEIRVRDALLRLAGAGDVLTGSIKLANDAWSENTALQTEVATRNETFAAQWQIFKNRITDVAIEFGQALMPALFQLLEAGEPLLDLVIGLVNWFTSLPKPVQTTVLGALALAAALGPILFIAGQMVTTFGSLVRTLGLVSTAMRTLGLSAAASNPLVLGLITALAGTYVIIKNWDKVKEWFEKFKRYIADIARTIWQPLWDFLKEILNKIIRAWNSLQFRVPTVSVFGRHIGGAVIGVPKLPELDTGGRVLSDGLAVIHSGEIVMPAAEVSRYESIVDERPRDLADGSTPINVVLDGRVIARALVPHYQDRERRTGRAAFAT